MTFVRCPLDADHVDAHFPCGHCVHTDLGLSAAAANPPRHECPNLNILGGER